MASSTLLGPRYDLIEKGALKVLFSMEAKPMTALQDVPTMFARIETDKQRQIVGFINAALDPQVQAEVAKFKKGSPVVVDAKIDAEVAKLPGVFTTADQWKKQAIIIDHKLRAEKTAEWRKWFAENIMN